jgi:hypothetical protein
MQRRVVKEYERPRCSGCKVLIKKEAVVCPHCGGWFELETNLGFITADKLFYQGSRKEIQHG